MGDEADVGLVDAHPEGDRRDHDQAVLAQEPGLVGGAGRRRRARRGTAAPGCRCAPGTRRSCSDRGAGQAVDDARRRRRARCAAGRAAAGAARPSATIRYWMLGRSKLATKCRGVGCSLQPLGDLGVRGAGRRRGQRDPRDVRPALVQHRQGQVVGPEVVAPLRRRSAPRRSRTARSGRVRAAARRLRPRSASGAR